MKQYEAYNVIDDYDIAIRAFKITDVFLMGNDEVNELVEKYCE